MLDIHGIGRWDMKRGGKVHGVNDMLVWLVAGFVPMSSQSKEGAVCCSVG